MGQSNKHKSSRRTAIKTVARAKTKWDSAQKQKWIAIQKGIGLSEDLGRFVGKIVGPAATSLGGLLGDQMKAWRAANLARIAKKWRQKCAKHDVPEEAIRALPFREAFLVLDAASMEDDEDVQELWARLIFAASQPHPRTELLKMHVDLLKSLNGLEARLLMIIFDYYDREDRQHVSRSLKKLGSIDEEQLRVALLNLQRLGILSPDIAEREILDVDTFEEWARTVTSDTIVDEFTKVAANVVWHLTNLTGSPLNDFLVGEAGFPDLLLSYAPTRIGFDLYRAVGQPGKR